MSNHTKEKWELIKHNGTNLYGAKGQNNDWFVFENALEKDAERIVACVNACEGLSDEDVRNIPTLLNEGTVAIQERDKLLAALKDIKRFVDNDFPPNVALGKRSPDYTAAFMLSHAAV